MDISLHYIRRITEVQANATLHNRRAVALNGLLGELHGGEAMGTVVFIAPDRHGMDAFDEYEIAFEDSRKLRVRSFQLTHVVLTADKRH